ncbi:MAG: hypothetical protein ACI4IQ_07230 [Eubacterium sp.]
MKEKFIRVLSPITCAVVAVLDIAVIGYGIFAVEKVIEQRSMRAIFFAAVEVLAIIVAILVTKEILSNGVVFREDEMEFTGIDENNLFDYSEIVSVETEKDEKASLVKNFTDRQSKVILTLKDEKVVTIDIGLTSKKALDDIEKEIKARILSE